MASVSGLSAPHRIEARNRTVEAMYLVLNHRAQVHYSQEGDRWEGITRKRNAHAGQYPRNCDCSSTATWALWNGLFIPFDVRDTVNGTNWTRGYTGTMLNHGKEVHHLGNVLRADCVIYGENDPDGEHTAVVVGRRKSDNKIMVISHGSEGGPYYLPYDYRKDIMCIRRYI
jgi:hypothetical protein